MQQFYLKEKVFAIKDSYKFYDDNNNVAYYAKAKFPSLKGKIEFFNASTDQKVFTLQHRLFRVLPVYDLYDENDNNIATIKKHFTFFKQKVSIESSMGNYDLEGNFMAYDFFITKDEKEVVDVHKKIFSFGDAYEILIDEQEPEGFLLAMVLLIDRMFHNRKNRSHSHRR